MTDYYLLPSTDIGKCIHLNHELPPKKRTVRKGDILKTEEAIRTLRKRYTKEFKLETIRLAESSGKPMAQIEKELSITNGLLGKWREKYKEGGPEDFPGKGNLKPPDERI